MIHTLVQLPDSYWVTSVIEPQYLPRPIRRWRPYYYFCRVGIHDGQYMGQIQIMGYGPFVGDLGFCLQMLGPDSSEIAVNDNSLTGYLKCTPTIGSSGNYFTAYPISKFTIQGSIHPVSS
jgi:hypothetical protein